MTAISDIDVNGVNTNLKVRFKRDEIYTYTGTILVAVNPYKLFTIYEPVRRLSPSSSNYDVHVAHPCRPTPQRHCFGVPTQLHVWRKEASPVSGSILVPSMFIRLTFVACSPLAGHDENLSRAKNGRAPTARVCNGTGRIPERTDVGQQSVVRHFGRVGSRQDRNNKVYPPVPVYYHFDYI